MNGEYYFLVKLLDLSFPVFSSLVFALNNLENPSLQLQRLLALLETNYGLKEIAEPHHLLANCFRRLYITRYCYELLLPSNGKQIIVVVEFAKQNIVCFLFSIFPLDLTDPSFCQAVRWQAPELVGSSSFDKKGNHDDHIVISHAEFFHLIREELNLNNR